MAARQSESGLSAQTPALPISPVWWPGKQGVAVSKEGTARAGCRPSEGLLEMMDQWGVCPFWLLE